MGLDPKYVFKLPFTEEGSYQDFKQLLDTKPELPTALVTDDDTIASGVMKALADKSVRIPEVDSLIKLIDKQTFTVIVAFSRLHKSIR